MSSLTDRLSNVEDAVFISSTKRSTPIPSLERSRHAPYRTSKPLAVHDLNISPIGSVAVKPRPLQRSEGPSANPLYGAPLRAPLSAPSPLRSGAWACATTEGRGDDLGEEPDLDDPTPSCPTLSYRTLSSCSLELMSDLEGKYIQILIMPYSWV